MQSKHKLYVIGGMSRVGKSLITLKIKEKRSDIEVLLTDRFRPNGDNDRAWFNLSDHLKNIEFGSDVLIEGVAITPERVRDLKLEKFTLGNVAFVGYGRESHADAILAYAYKYKDWIFDEIIAGRYTEQTVRDWMKPGILESEDIKKRAVENGFVYYDVTDFPVFDEYVNSVSGYLLNS